MNNTRLFMKWLNLKKKKNLCKLKMLFKNYKMKIVEVSAKKFNKILIKLLKLFQQIKLMKSVF